MTEVGKHSKALRYHKMSLSGPFFVSSENLKKHCHVFRVHGFESSPRPKAQKVFIEVLF